MTNEGLVIVNVLPTMDNGVYICRAEVNEEGRFDTREISVAVHGMF